MNLQDESFPADELLDEITFSPLPMGQHFQLPDPEQCGPQQLPPQQPPALQPPPLRYASKSTSTTGTTGTTNSPDCSSCASSEQNVSTDSQNGPHRPGNSNKTSVSETDAGGGLASKRSRFAQDNRPSNKACSFQDIHSEYTKRRFKHVPSKVGEYIATMKADDLKRRRKTQFERHRSMPETLTVSSFQLREDEKGLAKLHFSSDQLHHAAADSGGVGGLYETQSDDGVDGGVESPANTSVPTSNSNNNHKNAPSNNKNSNHSNGSHEANNDTNTRYSIAMKMYAQVMQEKERVQSYSEYLQTKVDEKSTENTRLKRNVDYLRNELTTCLEKLRQREREKAIGSSRLALFHREQPKSSKATQTDSQRPTSPVLLLHELYATPDTPDENNNNNKTVFDASTGNAIRAVKTVATIQPLSLSFSSRNEQDSIGQESEGNAVLRQRTNSFINTAKYKPSNQNKIVVPTNNSNNTNNRKKSNNSVLPDTESSATLLGCSPRFKSKQESPTRSTLAAPLPRPPFRNWYENVLYYDAQQYGLHSNDGGQDLNANSTFTLYEDENDNSAGSRRRATNKKQNTLRRGWRRLLGNCASCSDDPQHAFNNSNAMQTYTQIPLLEKSYENYCRNVR